MMSAARWLPAIERAGWDWELLCLRAGVTIRTVDGLARPNYARLATGPLFLVPASVALADRRAVLCELWCACMIEAFGSDFILGVMRHMVADTRAEPEEFAAD